MAAAQRFVEIVGIGLIAELEESVGDAALDIEIAAGANGENAGLAIDGAVIGAIGQGREVLEDFAFLAGKDIVFSID